MVLCYGIQSRLRHEQRCSLRIVHNMLHVGKFHISLRVSLKTLQHIYTMHYCEALYKNKVELYTLV